MSNSKSVAAAETTSVGGGQTYRVAVNHRDDDHDVSPVPFHYGPAYNDAFAATASEVLGVPASEVDLRELAEKGLARAQAEYPAADGWDCWVEEVVPTESNDSHELRRLPGKGDK